MATRLFSCGPLRVQLMAVNCLLAHHMYLTVQSNRTIVAFLGCDSRQQNNTTESLRVIREYRILSQDARRTKSFRGNCFVGPIGTKSYCRSNTTETFRRIQFHKIFPLNPLLQNPFLERDAPSTQTSDKDNEDVVAQYIIPQTHTRTHTYAHRHTTMSAALPSGISPAWTPTAGPRVARYACIRHAAR